jgi:hypothetical protein
MAASTRAMERSAVFMVPITNRLRGRVNGWSEYCSEMVSSRYSSRKYSSPNTLARLARFSSSITSR